MGFHGNFFLFLGAARRNVLFCIDDVDANDKKLSDFIKFFTEHFTWLTQSGLANHKNQVIVTTRLQSTASEVPFKSVRVNIDPIESQELTSILKIAPRNHNILTKVTNFC